MPPLQSDAGAVIKPCQDVVQSPDEHYISSLGCYLYHNYSEYTFRAKRAVLPTGNGNECTSKSERRLVGVANRHAHTCRVCTAKTGHCGASVGPVPPT